MSQWEYSEVWYEQKPIGGQVVVNVFSARGNSQQKHNLSDWAKVFAQKGASGWELVGVMASPTGTHQYWYYFKRPIS